MDASIENELPQLQDLRQEMQGMCQNFEQRIEKISENIRDLRRDMQSVQVSIETNFDDMDFNGRARVSNSKVCRAEHVLVPLRNTVTHQEINMPGTLGELNAIQGKLLSYAISLLLFR
ncbi:hypothetical protein F4823DRAFT_597398 [Ustulina deusta]|nr:hypothetical protein F4823DRAFT_597398 [Ustulina deusta]